ncbi:efflux RND transporter permease subunit, partial [Denitratimonas sp. CY0512]|uniref:efflux RND transporter permease subunit n=1 Tax=Denitratimonas sp. CY0512 TaxID=3131940 RepID=UPI00309E79E0
MLSNLAGCAVAATAQLPSSARLVRGRGYLRGIEDIESLVLRAEGGAPVLIGDVARVELVPDERRGIVDLDGEGDVVGGIVIARFGENALAVIGGVKDKIAQLASGLPEGVSVQAVYDRSDLIVRAIKTLRTTLLEESLIVALVCLVFLFHARSALVAIVMLPVGVLIAVIAMRA